jgi:hypothetical protein
MYPGRDRLLFPVYAGQKSQKDTNSSALKSLTLWMGVRSMPQGILAPSWTNLSEVVLSRKRPPAVGEGRGAIRVDASHQDTRNVQSLIHESKQEHVV